EDRADDDCFLSVVTASELLHGVHRAALPDQRARRAAFVEGVLERFPVLEVDVATARAHSALWAELAASGSLIGAHDLWIAAACIAHGLVLVTANVREFARVAGLRIEVWEDVALGVETHHPR
ncbi:MAG TPA: PIN domain-containing protein, partial [Coriobacteriia bacterium]